MMGLGFILGALGYIMDYWYWCFIGLLFFMSGTGVFKHEVPGKV